MPCGLHLSCTSYQSLRAGSRALRAHDHRKGRKAAISASPIKCMKDLHIAVLRLAMRLDKMHPHLTKSRQPESLHKREDISPTILIVPPHASRSQLRTGNQAGDPLDEQSAQHNQSSNNFCDLPGHIQEQEPPVPPMANAP